MGIGDSVDVSSNVLGYVLSSEGGRRYKEAELVEESTQPKGGEGSAKEREKRRNQEDGEPLRNRQRTSKDR